MAVVEMAGVTFIGPAEEIERVALALVGAESFEPMQPDVMMGGQPIHSRFRPAKANQWDALMGKLNDLRAHSGMKLLASSFIDNVPSVPFSELEAGIDGMLANMNSTRDKIAKLEDEYETSRAMLELSDAVRATGRKFSDVPRLPYGSITLGTASKDNWRRLRETGRAAPFIAVPVVDDGGKITFITLCSGEYAPEMEKVLASVHARVIPLRPEDFRKYDDGDVVRHRMESIKAEIKGYREMPDLYLSGGRVEFDHLYWAVYTMQRVYSACRMRRELSDKKMVVVSGWMPKARCDSARAMLANQAPNVLMIVEPATELRNEGQPVPTLLSNLPIIRRFQELVKLYSLPSYGETDPTFILAISFCLFFGFMFGDVGHGIALILGVMLLERKKIMGGEIAAVAKIAGGCSVLFGFLYGSVFGNEKLIHPIWLNPMESVNATLIAAMFIGVVIISIGMCLYVYNRIKDGDLGEALLGPEGVAGMAFFWIALCWAVGAVGNIQALKFHTAIYGTLLGLIFLVMLFGNPIAAMLFEGHAAKVDDGGAVHVISVLHALLSFISNTASFVRLAAFAMNHAGLCFAVATLAEMVRHVPGGNIFGAVLIIVGHLVIVGLEGLIVFIQTLRLEYYEFFAKFYRGGGRAFAPERWIGA
ncbi:MAG: hypothetical protein LBR38_07170 [Synergistaceae bacterium]|jgi:V/A-type H+-transporting ATPase subunit I|nr:hypothetical protein [Synergistaceae bacterium]